jgi:hypothetical protein
MQFQEKLLFTPVERIIFWKNNLKIETRKWIKNRFLYLTVKVQKSLFTVITANLWEANYYIRIHYLIIQIIL